MTEAIRDIHVDLLLVDDDDELRNGLIEYFRQLGYHAEGAASAELALPQLRVRAYHVAVFDLAMPGMTRVELLGRIKSENNETEIILLSGEGSIETAVDLAWPIRA